MLCKVDLCPQTSLAELSRIQPWVWFHAQHLPEHLDYNLLHMICVKMWYDIYKLLCTRMFAESFHKTKAEIEDCLVTSIPMILAADESICQLSINTYTTTLDKMSSSIRQCNENEVIISEG